jgi:hypothetical protein
MGSKYALNYEYTTEYLNIYCTAFNGQDDGFYLNAGSTFHQPLCVTGDDRGGLAPVEQLFDEVRSTSLLGKESGLNPTVSPCPLVSS